MMRLGPIGVDARCTRQMSVGMQRYARELAARLPRIAPDLQFLFFDRGENFSWREQIKLPLTLQRKRAACVHHLALYAPLLPSVPAIVTVHDLIHLQYPQYFKAHIGPYYRYVVRPLVRRAKFVITDDVRTVGELERRLGVDPRRVRVIALGVDDEFLRHGDAPVGFSEARPYVFYAGNHRPHKNLATLLAAWSQLPASVPFDLVLTGADDFGLEFPRERAGGARCFAIGDVDEPKLRRVMAGAAALVYPSLCEGFGLPMLEALAVGTAVIASDDAVPGVLRGACTVVPTLDIAAWGTALAAITESSLTQRAARRRVAARFTWDDCARATAAVYRELLQA